MTRPVSMTSFGRGEAADGSRLWTVEVKSVNHRYSDISIRMPRSYNGLEERVKKKVALSYSRGHVDVTIFCRGVDEKSANLHLNLSLATEYLRHLSSLRQTLSLADEPTLAMVASYKDVISEVEPEEDLDQIWLVIEEGLDAALREGLAMRQREGATLKADLSERLMLFRQTLANIEEQSAQVAEKKLATLQERLNRLLGDGATTIDPTRLAQEAVFLADKVDITEEQVRLKSHLDQFAGFLEMDEPVGRRLDFLLQEFLREINTMASKIAEASVTYLTVELKNEVEKMREQVQNLE